MPYLCVYVTAPDRDTAVMLAKTLVRERLAACANILDAIHSVYWWQGTMEEAGESALILKTVQERYASLEKRILELHPYDTPCVAAWSLERGSPDFLAWIGKETAPA